MRLFLVSAILPIALIAAGGCVLDPQDAGTSLIDIVTGQAGDVTSSASATIPTAQGLESSDVVSGSLSGKGDYELFDLGPARTGQAWTVASDGGVFGGRSFLVVLFDSEYDLLYRQVVSATVPLEHTIRFNTSSLYLGVTPSYGSSGGDFDLGISRRDGVTVPNPRPQTVWLNFGAASDVAVHARSGISFSDFDAGMLGSSYTGEDDVIKDAIVEAMREDYADYNLVFSTSDEGPPLGEPFSTIHFGGGDDRLLGLADNVDRYNTDRQQAAIVYVESFADFSVMRLSPEEMGQMVGNVASHELGHLLGLFHTKVPEDLMDTTGTAWDLAANQSFLRGVLEENVFPIGFENTPQRLAETVGYNPDAKENQVTKHLGTEKLLRRAAIRALATTELRYRCGNCLNPD